MGFNQGNSDYENEDLKFGISLVKHIIQELVLRIQLRYRGYLLSQVGNVDNDGLENIIGLIPKIIHKGQDAATSFDMDFNSLLPGNAQYSVAKMEHELDHNHLYFNYSFQDDDNVQPFQGLLTIQ